MRTRRASIRVSPEVPRGCLHGARSGLVERREKDKGGARGGGHDAGGGREGARGFGGVDKALRAREEEAQSRGRRAHRRGGRHRRPGPEGDRDRKRPRRPGGALPPRGRLRADPQAGRHAGRRPHGRACPEDGGRHREVGRDEAPARRGRDRRSGLRSLEEPGQVIALIRGEALGRVSEKSMKEQHAVGF